MKLLMPKLDVDKCIKEHTSNNGNYSNEVEIARFAIEHRISIHVFSAPSYSKCKQPYLLYRTYSFMCTDQKNFQNYFLVQFDSERKGGVGFFHPVTMSVRVANEICEHVGPNNDILGFFFPIVIKNKTITDPTDS